MAKPIRKILNELSYLTGRKFHKPEFLSLLLTHRCNFHCRSCSVWRRADYLEMDRREWLKLIKQIKRYFPVSTFIEINGGEALLKKNLVLEVIKELNGKFPNVTLNTNGSLITPEIIYELKKTGLKSIKLSLYSLNEAIHDDLRGQRHAFIKAKRALDSLNSTGIKVEIAILVTRYNIDTLPELIDHLNNLDNISIIIQSLDESIESTESKNENGNFLPLDLWPDKEQVEQFFSWLSQHNQKIKNSAANLSAINNYYLAPESTLAYRCFAGQRNLVIYPNGDTAFCFKGQPIGNIRQQPLRWILSSKKARQRRQAISHCQKYCRIVGCNFSRGIKEVIGNQLS